MVGKSHIVSNICTVAIGCELIYFAQIAGNPLTTVGNTLSNALSYVFINPDFKGFWAFAVYFYLFLMGTLLPDIDNEKSILGKHWHIKMEHRTWTHTVWFLSPLALLSIKFVFARWLALGYFLHLFWDSLSVGGICWFYPISQYKYFGTSGAKIKKNHKIYLYRVGKKSEAVLVTILVVISVLLLAFCVYLTFFTISKKIV